MSRMNLQFLLAAATAAAIGCDNPVIPLVLPEPKVVSMSIAPADTTMDIVNNGVRYRVEVLVENGASQDYTCSLKEMADGNSSSLAVPPQYVSSEAGLYKTRCVAVADTTKFAEAVLRVVKTDLIAFWRRTNHEYIFTMNSDGTDQKRVTSDTWQDITPNWSPDGMKIAFYRNNVFKTCSNGVSAVMTIRADGADLTRVTPCLVSAHDPKFSPDGNILVFPFVESGENRLNERGIATIGIDGSGFKKVTASVSILDWSPDWSPDGTRFVFSTNRDGNWEIYVMDTTGTNLVNLTNYPGWDQIPVWSPDGKKIAFARAPASWPQEGTFQIWVMNADGSNPVQVTNDPVGAVDPTWSPDGERIAYAGGCCYEETMDIWIVNVNGTGARNVTNSPAVPERYPAWR